MTKIKTKKICIKCLKVVEKIGVMITPEGKPTEYICQGCINSFLETTSVPKK